MHIYVRQYKKEIQTELCDILQFWITHAPDNENGGFYGYIDNDNHPGLTVEKGAVLNARILWTFSAVYNQYGEAKYLNPAQRAFDYIRRYFMDKKYGGIYWMLDYKGHPLDDKKQVYAQAFAIYALSEYYQSVQDERAKEMAVALYSLIQKYSYDPVNGGYLEAFTRQWKEMKDVRLSEKDANEKKTMNTHLHVLEAYTNLYRIWGSKDLKKYILELLNIFYDKIINPDTAHLQLFFDESWHNRPGAISYGHDIEASWLLLEAAEAVKDTAAIKRCRQLALKMADAAAEGLDDDGGLWYEKNDGRLVREKHWWVQAEAMVGFLNAYQISGNKRYEALSYQVWTFIKHYIRSPRGEWLWGTDVNRQPMAVQEKAGFWKCPYHNARACMEVIKRL